MPDQTKCHLLLGSGSRVDVVLFTVAHCNSFMLLCTESLKAPRVDADRLRATLSEHLSF